MDFYHLYLLTVIVQTVFLLVTLWVNGSKSSFRYHRYDRLIRLVKLAFKLTRVMWILGGLSVILLVAYRQLPFMVLAWLGVGILTSEMICWVPMVGISGEYRKL